MNNLNLNDAQIKRFLVFLRSGIEMNKRMADSYRNAPMLGYHDFSNMVQFCDTRWKTYVDVMDKFLSLIEESKENND